MRREMIIMAAVALFLCAGLAQATGPQGKGCGPWDRAAVWPYLYKEICQGPEPCGQPSALDECLRRCCLDCIVFEHCDECGKTWYCDGICDACNEICSVEEYCPSCGAKYPTERADGFCDRCGKECYSIEKCDSCGYTHYFNGYCDLCASRCQYARMCIDLCETMQKGCGFCRGTSGQAPAMGPVIVTVKEEQAGSQQEAFV
ncbi:MAG: hypothetical protein QUS08_01100 [Methanothrix sp.]|nr:hypothetical protein [Methanothrix sp.]